MTSSIRLQTQSPSATSWDFSGQHTRYGTHGIHTYVAAMIPQLARSLIDRYAPRRGSVLDPFCGGGSVLVEAACSGRHAIGRDVNALAILVSQAKTTPINVPSAEEALQGILGNMNGRSMGQIPVEQETIQFWFKPEHMVPLAALRHAIATQIGQESPLLSLFLTVFSATVRDVSLTYRSEIRLRRLSPEDIARFQVDPLDRFKARAKQAIATAAALPSCPETDITQGTVLNLDLRDDDCSTLICSPPYGDERNGVSYAQFSRNMLAWLGYTPQALKQSKALTLGWGKAERTIPVSPTLDRALSAITAFPNSVREAVAFYADYQDALVEMARVTSGATVIVIGKRVLRDTVFDNGAITTELMQQIGVPLVEEFSRKLPTKRLPKMRKFGAAINRESILVFRK